jgi:hypothetical protein
MRTKNFSDKRDWVIGTDKNHSHNKLAAFETSWIVIANYIFIRSSWTILAIDYYFGEKVKQNQNKRTSFNSVAEIWHILFK